MPAKGTTAYGPAHFVSRELSWLEFNQRVLNEALDARNPLLERVKFFCIASSNLDEFFEVRVAGLKQQIESDVVERTPDGLTTKEQLARIGEVVRGLVGRATKRLAEDILPALARSGIRVRTVRGFGYLWDAEPS